MKVINNQLFHNIVGKSVVSNAVSVDLRLLDLVKSKVLCNSRPSLAHTRSFAYVSKIEQLSTASLLGVKVTQRENFAIVSEEASLYKDAHALFVPGNGTLASSPIRAYKER